MRRARWKRKNVGRLKSTGICRFARRRGVVLVSADENRKSSAGCAGHRWNRDRPPPHGGSPGLLSGWSKHRLFFYTRAFRFAMRFREIVGAAAEKGAGPCVYCHGSQRQYQMRGRSSTVLRCIRAPGTNLDLPPHRLARPPYLSKPAQRAGFGHKSGFFSSAAAATFL